MSKIYVAGAEIGRAIQKEDLEEKFGKFGRVVSVWVARQPPGFAFVEFEDERDAEDAIREMNNKEILGCEVTCEPSRGPRDRGNGNEETKPGDWQCRPCGVNNFARRFECFRCGAPKEGGGGGGGGDRGGGGGRDRYDDRRGGGGDRYDDRRRSRSPPRRRSGSRDRRRDSRERSPARRGDSRERRD